MNFTREPIIETIITPKEGYKLVVRNSKGGSQEEYTVDAVEVISFGHSFFFRSLEKPKAFLVPVTDFEIVETKETRVVLKTATIERSIKIGGGREAPMKTHRESPAPEGAEESEGAAEQTAEEQQHPRSDRKRDRRRNRRRRSMDDRQPHQQQRPMEPREEAEAPSSADELPREEEEAIQLPSPPPFSRLIPPPPTLISEKFGRPKKEAEPIEPPLPKEEDEGESSGEPQNLSRSTLSQEALDFSSTDMMRTSSFLPHDPYS